MRLLDVDTERRRLDDLQRRIDHARHDLADLVLDDGMDDGEIPYRYEGRYGPVDETIVPPG